MHRWWIGLALSTWTLATAHAEPSAITFEQALGLADGLPEIVAAIASARANDVSLTSPSASDRRTSTSARKAFASASSGDVNTPAASPRVVTSTIARASSYSCSAAVATLVAPEVKP